MSTPLSWHTLVTRWVNAPDHGNDLGPWLDAARRSALGHDIGSAQDIDNDEDALRAYNAMLARLAARERRSDDRPASTKTSHPPGDLDSRE